MTLPDGLIHHWDPSVGSGGSILQDTVGGVHGVLGRRVVTDYFDPKAATQIRERPSGFGVAMVYPPEGSIEGIAVNRAFQGANEVLWTDYGSPQVNANVRVVRSAHFIDYPFPSVVPAGVRTTCRAHTANIESPYDNFKWIYVDLWLNWDRLMFPASKIVKLFSVQANGADKLWFGLEPATDALGNMDDRYNDQGDIEMFGCMYMPDNTKLDRNMNSIVQFQRWAPNRIQLIVKLGTTDGQAHLYVNDVLVSSHTGLSIGADVEWDRVDIAPIWGQIGDGNYSDVWRWGFDEIRLFHCWIGLGNPASLSWPSDILHQNEPVDFIKQHQCSFDGGELLRRWTDDHHTTVISPGFLGYDRQISYGVPNEFATPMRFFDRKHERFGSGCERQEHSKDSYNANAGWYAGTQMAWAGGYALGYNHCHGNYHGDVYACVYVRFDKSFKCQPEVTAFPHEYDEFTQAWKPIILGMASINQVYTLMTDSRLAVKLDMDYFLDVFEFIYLDLYVGGVALGTRTQIERDKVYKIEMLVHFNNVGFQQDIATEHNIKWWLNGALKYNGDFDPEVFHIDLELYNNDISAIRQVFWVGDPVLTTGYSDVYYMYASTAEDGYNVAPEVPTFDKRYWKSPDWGSNYLSYNEGGQQADYFGVEHVKIPIDGKDGFWVGEDRHDYALMFVLTGARDWEDQYVIDSWQSAFNKALPSIVWAGASDIRPQGQQFTASGGVINKIQWNKFTSSWTTITDTPGPGWHTLTMVVRRYTAERIEFYLDGVLVYEADWDADWDGRWFAGHGNNVARSSDETFGELTFFSDCLEGGRGLSPYGFTGTDCDQDWIGGFKGRGGSVLMWDRPLMPEEVVIAHEHMRQTYTTLPVATPVTSTPTDPVFSTQAIVNNIMIDLAWSASIDAQGADIKYEVESSTDGGTIWNSFRTLDDLEPQKLTKLQVSTRNFGFVDVRFRVRAFNGINYSEWDEGTDLSVTKWPKLLARTPTRGGGWFNGVTQYPGTRYANDYGCINPSGIPYDIVGDGIFEGFAPKPNFYIAYESPGGERITHVHFWRFVLENNIDSSNFWVWDVDHWEGGFAAVNIDRDFAESAGYQHSSIHGWWTEHWIEIDPGRSLTNPTKIGFSLYAFEHNSWYPDQKTIGFAVDMVKINDVPDSEEEDAPPVSIQGGCADYEAIWLHAPILNDMETGFVSGDTHQFARQVKGFGALTIVGDANFEIVRYRGESPVFIAKTITPFDNGDGSYDFQVMLTEAETASIGDQDAYHYQLRFTLSDGSVVTPNAGLIKGVPFEVVV